MTITLELTEAMLNNNRLLVVAGAKSPHTDENAIHAAAELLVRFNQAQAQAAQEANQPKANGHADAVQSGAHP